jgi:hypothetical protein
MKNLYDKLTTSPLFYLLVGFFVAGVGIISLLTNDQSSFISIFNVLIGGYLIGLGTAFYFISR